jgi:hypothetical protein
MYTGQCSGGYLGTGAVASRRGIATSCVNALFSIVQSSILLDPALAQGRKLAVVPLIIVEDIPTHN